MVENVYRIGLSDAINAGITTDFQSSFDSIPYSF